ncbi:hypothetical protein GCM10011368_10790 [Hyunsoonleella pacifica]|nr:hypothetical protein GCM10011368_10790 [Hyunsoonleella pacifica]
MLLFSQVKIGDNPSLIDSNSILELESNNKVLVITRLSQTEIDGLVPLEGALVYNTDTQCIYVFEGTNWKNLCNEPNITVSNTGPTSNNIGDFWFNSTNNNVSVWDGNQWLSITINPRRGLGTPEAVIVNPIAGDIYVDQSTGDIYTYNGVNWVPLNQSIAAENGLSISSNTIQLGGILTTPTVITTNNINTLAIQGLDDTFLDNNNNSIVVVDNTSGVLKKVSATNLVTQEQVVITATEGQTQFAPPRIITDVNKIDVYRNGARIAFSLVNATTIEVEAEATCFEGDEIRIVQIN